MPGAHPLWSENRCCPLARGCSTCVPHGQPTDTQMCRGAHAQQSPPLVSGAFCRGGLGLSDSPTHILTTHACREATAQADHARHLVSHPGGLGCHPAARQAVAVDASGPRSMLLMQACGTQSWAHETRWEFPEAARVGSRCLGLGAQALPSATWQVRLSQPIW